MAKSSNKKLTAFRIPLADLTKIEAIGKRLGLTTNDIIQLALKGLLNKKLG